MVLDPADEKVVADVAEHGFHSLGVEGEGVHPQFRYSVGFWESLNSPEVLIYGLDLKLAHSMLWEMFRQIKAGKMLRDRERWSGLLEGYDCISRPIDPSQFPDHVGFALWYRRFRLGDASNLRAFQLFWPSVNDGHYPWEQGCPPRVRNLQPLLYLPLAVGIA
ncbi:MAG TPA: DUF4262 domain-containing protein [Caulobacteraceae bacterium]|jgi:hypothetical protein|nr:DUF4262 domain-containing protein [Caulobacteraceae bacterium]